MELNALALPEYWESLATDGVLRVSFVVPTGRASDCPHVNLALASDALYFAEIALAIGGLARQADLAFEVRCLFDIDAFEDVQGQGDPLAENLIVSGSANVSVVTQQLLDNAMAYDTYKAGFVKPYNDPKIASASDTDDSDPAYNVYLSPRVGLLAMYKNPWAQKRVALLCAGFLAVGTIASMQLLLEYLRGVKHGNNRFLPSVPLKLVDGIERYYHNTGLKDFRKCKPPMDLRNLSGLDVKE